MSDERPFDYPGSLQGDVPADPAAPRRTMLLDVACSGCGAGVGEPCKKTLRPHRERYRERDRQRAEDGS